MVEVGHIFRSVEALIADKYQGSITKPLTCYTAVVVEMEVDPRKAWTSGVPSTEAALLNPENSEDQHLEYLQLQHNHTNYFLVKVPLSKTVVTEDEDGLQTRGGRKRKAGEHNVLTPNPKKQKVVEGLQEHLSSIKLQEPNPRKILKTKRRSSLPESNESSEGIFSDASPSDPFALSSSCDNVKPPPCPVFVSGPQVTLGPDYPSFYLSERELETFNRNKETFEAAYEELGQIGHGGFGIVFNAVRLLDSKQVAVKHIPRRKVTYTPLYGQWGSEVAEVLLMQYAAGDRGIDSMLNPAIIGFEEVYELENEVLIIMERPADAMDLCNFFKSSIMLEHEAKSVMKQVINAAVIMHKNGVFHRDLKPENILVSFTDEGPSVKIIDFGCADWVSDSPYNIFSGTHRYAPPEFNLHNEYQAEQTTVWQIGLLLCNLFTVKKYGTCDHINGPQCTIDNLSQQGNAFVSWCLAVEPNCRPCLEELQQHPWFHGLTTP